MKKWADRDTFDIPQSDSERLSVDEIQTAARTQHGDVSFASIGLHSRQDMPPVASRG